MSTANSMHFIDESKQKHYLEKGYATAPFLNKEQIDLLEQIFHKYFKLDELPDVYDTVATSPAETIKAVNEEVSKICKPLLESLMRNYHWVCSIYFVKKSSEESSKGIHLDTSMTTEEYSNIGMWIPLCDIDERNGRICLLSGSETMLPPYSTPSLPYAYEKVEHIIEPKLTCLSMKAGEVLFFNNNMLHCTQKNVSRKTRLAVIIKLIDINAPLATIYYDSAAPSGKQVSLYEHSKAFFENAEFRNPTPPMGSKFLKFIPELPHVLTEEELATGFDQRKK